MKKKSIALGSLVLGLVLVIGAIAVPAGAASSVNVSANVPLLATLTVDNSTVDFGSVTPNDTTPTIKTTAETVRVSTNSTNWSLSEQVSSNFSDARLVLRAGVGNTGSVYDIPVAPASPKMLAQSQSGAATEFVRDYGLLAPWAVPPAQYSASVTYTLVAP